jgi:hypothetical protein
VTLLDLRERQVQGLLAIGGLRHGGVSILVRDRFSIGWP